MSFSDEFRIGKLKFEWKIAYEVFSYKKLIFWDGWGKIKYEREINVMKSSFDFECASFSQFAFSSWWLCQNVFTVVASYHWLSMAENHWCLVASSAFDVHEVAVWSGNQSFEFVGLSLLVKGWVKDISFHGECWLIIKNIIYEGDFKIGI